jgi:iron(III) transport system permease protein
VFIDLVKELPLTLILRPFNFNTLATKSFEYANDEMIHEASIAALIIITISILAILSMNRLFKKEAT